MKKLSLIVMFIFLVSGLSAQKKIQSSDKRLAGIEPEFEKLLTDWNAAGFAVAVVEKNKIIYSNGFGYRDVEKKLPVSSNTIFAIGSCTKAFTTSLLGILASENKLKFADKPSKYIPELKFFNKDMDNTIIIEDLMTHRTGIPRHDFSWYLFPTHSKDSLIQRIEFQRPFAGVREKWYYNNFMFLTQGVIIERITGKSWEDNVKEKIFKPLGMLNSSLDINGLKSNPEAATGYTVTDNKTIEKQDYFDIAAMSPAGSINSNVDEMSNWLITWINGGKFKGTAILPSNFVNEAMSSHMVIGGGLPDKENPDVYLSDYGYGWFIASYRGHYRVEHGGNIDGFSASTCFFPSDSIGIVVLTNQNGSVIPSIVRNIISDRLLKLKTVDWSKKIKEQYDEAIKSQKDAMASSSKNQKTGTKTSHIKVEYIGTYTNPGYGSLQVILRNDSLFAQTPNKQMWLKHHHYDVFVPHEVVKGKIDTSQTNSIFLNFSTDDMGDISGFTAKLEPTIDALQFKHTPVVVDIDKKILESYVGEYQIGGMTAKVYMKGDKDLYLFVPGQPEYELMATALNHFSIKILEGYKVEFLQGGAGKIEAMNFIQPNGTFKATKTK